MKNKENSNGKIYKFIFLIIASSVILFTSFLLSSPKPNFLKDLILTFTNPKIKIISSSPRIIMYHDFITDEEAEHLIDIGRERLHRSLIATEIKDENSSVKLSRTHSDHRTSSSAFLDDYTDDTIKSIEKRICDLIHDCTINKMEDLQIIQYSQGQQYKAHHDYHTEARASVIGQRHHTFLIYLNTLKEEDGGQTKFPLLNIKVKPKRGNMLYFQNVKDGETEGDENTLHSGEPLLTNVEKWAVNVWIKNRNIRDE